jgi:hypothetical protein
MFMVSSCNGDKDSAEKFSKLGVEENKTIVENSGIDFIKVLERMRAVQTVDAIGNLADITSSSDKKGIQFFRDSKLFSTLLSFNSAAKGTKPIHDVFGAMISLKGEDPESIQQFWNENVGT